MDPTSFYLQLLLFPDIFLLLILSKEGPSKHFCMGCSFRIVIPLHLISFSCPLIPHPNTTSLMKSSLKSLLALRILSHYFCIDFYHCIEKIGNCLIMHLLLPTCEILKRTDLELSSCFPSQQVRKGGCVQ